MAGKKKTTTDGETPQVKGKFVQVYDKAGAFVRTFSEEVHGKNYAELAEKFVAKHGGSTK